MDKIVWNITCLHHQVAKIKGLEHLGLALSIVYLDGIYFSLKVKPKITLFRTVFKKVGLAPMVLI